MKPYGLAGKSSKGETVNHRQRGGNPNQRKRRKAEKLAIARKVRHILARKP